VKGLATEASNVLSHNGYRTGELSLAPSGESSTTAIEYGTSGSAAAQSVATMLDVAAPPQPRSDVAAGHVRVVLGSGYALPADIGSLATAPSGGESLGIDVGSTDSPTPNQGAPITGSGIPCVN
jgi:hypothetical protein